MEEDFYWIDKDTHKKWTFRENIPTDAFFA